MHKCQKFSSNRYFSDAISHRPARNIQNLPAAALRKVSPAAALAAAGHKPICVWSLANTEHPMTEEQLLAREYILQNEELPPQYDLFIFNGSCETSINIHGHVDYFIAHTANPTSLTQARGRYRGDLDLLYVYRITPPFIINSDYIQAEAEKRAKPVPEDQMIRFAEQNLLNDREGYPFLITLNEKSYEIVKEMVEKYCTVNGLDHFDIAPYENKTGIASMDEGAILYQKVARYINPSYHRGNLCVTFNIGTKHVYENLYPYPFDYEMAKYKKQNKAVLAELKIGDSVNAKFCFDHKVFNGEVVNLNEHTIELAGQVNGSRKIRIEPIFNLIFLRKSK